MKTILSWYNTQIRNIYNGEPWYGDSLQQKLQTVTAEEAFTVAASGTHSIAQLVAHILIWRRLLIERIKGNNDFQIHVNSSRDWTPGELLEKKGWETLLAELDGSQTELLRLLESETDALLDRPLPDGKHALRLLLDGIVQHDVYHIGQIGVVQALLRSRTPVELEQE